MLRTLRARAADFFFAAPLTIAFIAMFVFFAYGARASSPPIILGTSPSRARRCSSSRLLLVSHDRRLHRPVRGIDRGLQRRCGGISDDAVALAPALGLGRRCRLGRGAGLITGFLVAHLGFSALIVTLGMLTILRGTTFVITDQTFYDFGAGFSPTWVGPLSGSADTRVDRHLRLYRRCIFLKFTSGGRHVYAIGVNQEAAYFSGIDIRRIPLLLFVVSGAAAGLAGIITIARIDAAPSGSLGVGVELNALTAVLLGGVSFAGGRGNVFGIVLGVLFLGVLQNGLAIMNVSFANQQIANGLALVLATALEGGGAWISARTGRVPGQGTAKTVTDTTAAPTEAMVA